MRLKRSKRNNGVLRIETLVLKISRRNNGVLTNETLVLRMLGRYCLQSLASSALLVLRSGSGRKGERTNEHTAAPDESKEHRAARDHQTSDIPKEQDLIVPKDLFLSKT